MKGTGSKNAWALFLFMLTGIVLGGFIGMLAEGVPALSWLGYGQAFGLEEPIVLNLGILAFSLAVIFQLVTLPVEFNASGRAVHILGGSGMLYDDEVNATKKVLFAAALTYVAGAISSILQLLRIIMIANNRRR